MKTVRFPKAAMKNRTLYAMIDISDSSVKVISRGSGGRVSVTFGSKDDANGIVGSVKFMSKIGPEGKDCAIASYPESCTIDVKHISQIQGIFHSESVSN